MTTPSFLRTKRLVLPLGLGALTLFGACFAERSRGPSRNAEPLALKVPADDAPPPPPTEPPPPDVTVTLDGHKGGKELLRAEDKAEPEPDKPMNGVAAKRKAPPMSGRVSGGPLGATAHAGDLQELGNDRGTLEGGEFEAREARTNPMTVTAQDRLSTFAVDVDTAAYSIARRTLDSDRLPTASLVRVEEFLNYFKYDYEVPESKEQLFSIQADGARSPVDAHKHLLRVGLQARPVSDAERLPTNLVFLVDTSCSMTSDDKLNLAKTALKLAVDRLGAKDKVAITTYAGGVELVLPPTEGTDKVRIKRAIDSLSPNGGTAMQSGLELAYKQAGAMLRDNSITRIIVCSDGDANIGATTPEAMLQTVEGYVKEGVFLSTIGFGDGNYKDAMMEQLANKGNGNYFYVDSRRQAERVFSRDFNKMIQDVAQDVKIQVELNPELVASYRLVGYENRDIADRDFRNDKVDAGEIGAGHQVTALYELMLKDGVNEGNVAKVRIRAKQPRGSAAKETGFDVPLAVVNRPFGGAPADFRFATAVMGGAELLRHSPYAAGWSFARVMSIVSDTNPFEEPDRAEFLSLMKKAAYLSGESAPVGMK